MLKPFYLINKDIKLERLPFESDSTFYARVIYSAMSLWIRTSTLDSGFDIQGNETDIWSTKKHVLERCTVILNELLSYTSSSINWFKADEEEQPAKITRNAINEIRERLLKTSEIHPVGYGSRIGLLPQSSTLIDKNHAIFHGINNIFSNGFSSGLAWIIAVPSQFNDEFYLSNVLNQYSIQDIAVTLWFKLEFTNAISNKMVNLKESLEYLNVNSSRNILEWSVRPNSHSGCIMFARDVSTIPNEYFLIKKTDDTYEYLKIDDYYISNRDLNRIVIALRKIAGNPLAVKILKYPKQKSFVLNKHFSFPQQEECLLWLLGWPANGIKDGRKMIFPDFCLPLILKIISNFEINLVEEIDG